MQSLASLAGRVFRATVAAFAKGCDQGLPGVLEPCSPVVFAPTSRLSRLEAPPAGCVPVGVRCPARQLWAPISYPFRSIRLASTGPALRNSSNSSSRSDIVSSCARRSSTNAPYRS